jgi:hypothetical protein
VISLAPADPATHSNPLGGRDLAVRYRPIHRVNRAVPSGAPRCGAARHHGGEQISGRDVAATIDAATRCSAIPGQAGRHPAHQLGRVPALRDSAGPNQLRWENHGLRTSARRRHGGVIRHRTATAMRLADAAGMGTRRCVAPTTVSHCSNADAGNAGNEFPDTGTDLYRDSYPGMIDAALARERRGSPTALDSAGNDARPPVTQARYVPTPILDSLHRKAFGLPAPGSRATAGVVRGATR